MRQVPRALAIFVPAILAFVPSPRTSAQVAGTSFEIASVKRSNPSPGQRLTVRPGSVQPGGRWIAQNATFRLIMQTAYPEYAHRDRIVGGPSWIESERFEIDARADGEPSNDRLRLMVRNLLAERFNLKVHTEVQAVNVYALVRLRADGTVGPGLRPPIACRPGSEGHGVFTDRAPQSGELPPCGIWVVTDQGIRRYLAGEAPLSSLFPSLQLGLDRPLVDRTQLEGTFSIQLEVEGNTSLQAGAPSAAGAGTQLYTAIREQLGLALEPRQERMEVLVIDDVQMPSPN